VRSVERDNSVEFDNVVFCGYGVIAIGAVEVLGIEVSLACMILVLDLAGVK
jgi:hypothetical protein